MATVVQSFEEGAYIITSDGEEIPVYEGMEIYPEDQLVGNIIVIDDPTAVDPGSDPTSIVADDIAAIQQALLAGADPTQVTEATAAGPAGAGDATDGGGTSFVTLDRTGGEVDPTAGYRTGTFGSTVLTNEDGPNTLAETVVEPEPQDPIVTTVIETKTEVRTETETKTVVGDEYETGRTTETASETTTDETGTTVTTTTTTTITYDKETNTITTTKTITETYQREVSTTAYPDGTTTTETGEWTLTDTETETDTQTETTNNPREEIIEDVDTEFTPVEPEEPVVTVTKEYDVIEDISVKTSTTVGDEYETGRTSETTTNTVSTETKDTTTTVTTTTITYNQVTDTVTTTTIVKEYFVRDVTTTIYPDGTTDVQYSTWTQYDTTTDTSSTTDTVETPRTEVLTDEVVTVDLHPVAVDDTYSTDEDTPVNGSVGDNDTKGDGEHVYSLVGGSIPGLEFNNDGTFTYTPEDKDGDQEVSFDYTITDADGDESTATVTINIDDVIDPEPEEVGEWFFAHGGNFEQPGYDYELVTDSRRDGSMEINVSNKQLGDYKIAESDLVKFTIDITGDAEYNTDYTLDIVSKSPQIDIDSWSVQDNVLSVVISGTKDVTNLSGSTFAIEVTSVNTGPTVGVEFDISTVVHYNSSVPEDVNMGTWETNDDVLIGLVAPEFVE